MRVTVVGLGAIGSPTVHNARNWVATLKLIDFDKVEMKNTQAQEYPQMARGRNKAQATAQSLQAQWKRKCEVIPHRLTSDNALQLLGDVDLLIDCTDNIEARLIIQGFAIEHGIPCLHGCLAATGDFARVIWTEHFSADQEANDGVPTCEDGVLLPFYSIVGGHIAQEAQRFLLDGTKRSFQLTPTSYLRLA
mgnify:CR=1 FL=1